MLDRPWWAHALQWGLWIVVMAVVMGWLARSRMRARATGNPDVLRHPRSVLLVGVVSTGFFLALAGLSWFYPNTTGSPLITSGFLVFALLGTWWIVEFFHVEHRLESGGFRYRTIKCGTGFLRWSDVTRIRYSHSAKWFRIDGAGGEAVRISAMLMSLPEFAQAALRAVPDKRIESDTLDLLKQTANGSPPSIWG